MSDDGDAKVIRVQVPGTNPPPPVAPNPGYAKDWVRSPGQPAPEVAGKLGGMGGTLAGIQPRSSGAARSPSVKVLGVSMVESTGTTVQEEEPLKTSTGFAAPHDPPQATVHSPATALARVSGTPQTPTVVGTELALVRHAPQPRDDNGGSISVGLIEALAHHPRPPGAAAVPLLHDPESAAAAEYRVLRHRLRVAAPDARVLAVAAPREVGLSSEVAINLAVALSEDEDEPVLVVDANFGSPVLAKMLEVTPPVCFAFQMHDMVHLAPEERSWVAMSIGFEHLHLLAIDPESDATTRRFHPPVFRAALTTLKEAPYKTIIVDLPPPLGSSGFNVAGDLVDGVFLVAVNRTTKKRDLQLAAERLAPVPMVGTVLLNS